MAMFEIASIFSKIKKNLLEEKENSKIFYIGLTFLALSFLLLMLDGGTGISGIVGRTFGFLILAILGYSLVDWNLNITESAKFWKEKKELDKIVNLPMQDTSKILKRACKGEKTCQKNLSENIIKIFFIKLKEKRGFNEEEVQALLRDQDEFRKTVQDEVISDFILAWHSEDKKDDDEKDLTRKIRSFFSSDENPKEYKKEIEEIIRRLKEWN